MSGGKGYTFSSDNEDEMNDWIHAFQAALKKGHSDQENIQNDEALDTGIIFKIFNLRLIFKSALFVKVFHHIF